MKFTLSSIVAIVATDATDPIAKILELITQCQAKVISEGEEAQKVYAEYAEWCEDGAKNLGYEVKTARGQADELQAILLKETSTQQALTSKIESIGADIASDEKELAAATKIRDQEAAEFQANEKELAAAADALARAIAVVEREMETGGASMMQLKSANSLTQVFKIMVQASAINTADAQKLTAFVQSSSDDDDDDSLGAPAAAAYESHSGGIVEILGGLHDQANEQLDKIRKSEQQARFNYEQMKQSLDDAIKYANDDLSESKKSLAASQEAQGTAQGDLDVTQKDLAEDSSTLADLRLKCMARSQDFETQATSRSEELKGLAAAKDAVSKIQLRGTESMPPSMRGTSFLQVSAAEDSANQAIHNLRDIARKRKDTFLAQIASRMASTMNLSSKDGEDVFAKIKAQLEDSIAKLQDEQAADATQTAYCKKQMAEAKEKVAAKEAKVEKHTTKIDKKSTTSSRVKEEVAILQKELAQMVKEKLEMDALRQKEKADYDFNKAETSQSLTEIKYALKVLRDFYGSYMKEHSGFSSQDGAADAIIGMLEVTESEFSKSIYEMTGVEEAAVSEYTEAVKTFETGKVVKEQAIKYKTREFTSLDKAVSEETTDREGTQSELNASRDALKTLEDMCIGEAETYQDRVARREAEMADLKETLEAIENEAASFVQLSAKRFRGGVRTHSM